MQDLIPRKVRAYIFNQERLLVFHEPGFPEACYQVPGGTVDQGESLIQALAREIEEESGFEILGEWKLVGHEVITHPVSKLDQEEFIYYLDFNGELPQCWDHTVTGAGEDKGILFRYSWMEISKASGLLLPWMSHHLEQCLLWRENKERGEESE